ncbi:hypothetical protein [Acinetobacter tandoii]|jgi:hypothetical protein|uniref:hypothetical protein n=1 Tax=Acinetobacter tandoii TaxID=202954 RepID=UPI003018E592
MIPVQEIDFYLSDTANNTVIIQTEINLTDSKTFTAWHDAPVYLDKVPYIKNLIPINEEYKNATDAFLALLEKFSILANTQKLEIFKINNPNNCELISEALQNETVCSKNFEIEITVNDPPAHESP